MSPAPGVTVTSRESPPASSPPIDIGTLFIAALADRGPADEALLIRNLDQFVDSYGDRVAYGYGYDVADAFFHEGGARLYVGRVVGPDALVATRNLSDGSANTLRVDAISPGAWGNDLTITTTHPGSGTFQFEIKEDASTVELSPIFSTNTEAVAWESDYIVLTDLGGNDPAIASNQALSAGTDDRTNITETEWLDALNLFTKDKGPGQVAAPGRTTDTVHANLQAHAEANNRIPLFDGVDTSTVASLTASAVAVADDADTHPGGQFTPYAVVPGGVAIVPRTVPYSAIQAGILAYNDGRGVSANQPAAGREFGRSRYAVGLSQPGFSEDERGELNDAGVTVAIESQGEVITFGERSVAVDGPWRQLANARLNMLITAQAGQVAEGYLFRQIDGRGIAVGEFKGDLEGLLLAHYNAGALYGDTPDEAFRVVTDDPVNTPEQLEAGTLKAVLQVRISPAPEFVEIEILKTSITEAI